MKLELPHTDPRLIPFASAVPYKGRRTVKVEARETVSVADYWDDGSRNYFYFMNLNGTTISDAAVGFVQQERGNPYSQRIGTAKLQAGLVGVEHTIYRGKDLGLRVYFCPDDYKRLFA